MRIRERPGFHFESVVPITAAHALHEIAADRERSGFPLFNNVAVLMEHQPRIFEEIRSAPTKVNSTPACRSDGTTVHTCE